MELHPHPNSNPDAAAASPASQRKLVGRPRNISNREIRVSPQDRMLSQYVGTSSTSPNLELPTSRSEPSISLERLLLGAREEMGRLTLALEQFDCDARLVSMGGDVTPLWTRNGRALLISRAPCTFSAPIADPRGNPAAALELITHEQDASDNLHLLLGAFIRNAANALAERWFRVYYRTHWVVLAMPLYARDKAIMLALDHNYAVIGACASARRMLESIGCDFEPGLPVRSLFRGAEAILLNHRYSDRDITLRGPINAEPWAVLTTPPATGPYSDTAERDVLHARPRLDVLRCLEGALSKESVESGLPPRILRCIEKYIDAHLDSTLNVDDLAASAGISTSHFSRCFRNSVGLTPHNYVMQRRLLRAQHLLLTTGMALSEVALSTGFSDQSHFSRKFHQFMGTPPRAFRVRHR